jgi:glycosyltransferase involved in cell wall biosynthesis
MRLFPKIYIYNDNLFNHSTQFTLKVLKMKIAVFHNLPTGGAKRALYDNVKYLAESNQVDVFVPSTANESYLSLKDVSDSFKIFPVKNTIGGFVYSAVKYLPSRTVSLKNLEITQKSIANYINKMDYDVVFCEQDVYGIAPFLLKYIKKPHVYYCQQNPFSHYQVSRNIRLSLGFEDKSLIKDNVIKYYMSRIKKVDKQNIQNAGYMLANSFFSHESLLRVYGINSFVSYLGVDNQLFKQIDIPKENFILSVGRCIPEKGYDFILNSLAKIDPNIRPELIIVSDLVDIKWKNFLEKLAVKSGIKLKILSLIEDRDLVLLYNKAKLVVYAPYLEPFGLVPLEAMACGTPVVAVKEGGIRESVIHNATGILTQRDETIFAEKIVELLLNNEKMEKMSIKSVKTVKNFWNLKKSGKRLHYHLNRAIDFHDNYIEERNLLNLFK